MCWLTSRPESSQVSTLRRFSPKRKWNFKFSDCLSVAWEKRHSFFFSISILWPCRYMVAEYSFCVGSCWCVSASAQGFQLNKHAVNRRLSHGGHFESQENKKLCFCTSSIALDERLAVQNLLFQHCVIKVYRAIILFDQHPHFLRYFFHN